MVLAASIIFSISTFSLVDSGDKLSITAIQAKKKTRQLPDLLDQQIAILVGLDINPNWVREQSVADSLIYGVVKSNDTAPAGINEDYSYPIINNYDEEISLFFKADKKKVTIKYANHSEKLYAEIVPLS